MKLFKKVLLSMMIVIVTLTMSQVAIPGLVTSNVVQAANIKINKTSYKMKKGQKVQLKISGTKKKVKWYSSNKKVAKVSSTGKVTALKKGTAKITAKVGNKKFYCKITVKASSNSKSKSKSKIVYITNTGSKYHCSGCRYLKKSKTKKSLSDAKLMGYSPCKVCRP